MQNIHQLKTIPKMTDAELLKHFDNVFFKHYPEWLIEIEPSVRLGMYKDLQKMPIEAEVLPFDCCTEGNNEK